MEVFDEASALHLLRLISPSLPVGAFSYSRSLEYAVEARWVRDEATTREWILGTLENSFAVLDGALFWRMINALHSDKPVDFVAADTWLSAARESRELQLEDRRMGEALMRLLIDLDVPGARHYSGRALSYSAAFAIAAHHWSISPSAALMGLMWSVAEAQVGAALRLVRLGHTAGQRILIDLVPVIQRSTILARTLNDDEIGNVSVTVAMGSAWHETQYSRLFRS